MLHTRAVQHIKWSRKNEIHSSLHKFVTDTVGKRMTIKQVYYNDFWLLSFLCIKFKYNSLLFVVVICCTGFDNIIVWFSSQINKYLNAVTWFDNKKTWWFFETIETDRNLLYLQTMCLCYTILCLCVFLLLLCLQTHNIVFANLKLWAHIHMSLLLCTLVCLQVLTCPSTWCGAEISCLQVSSFINNNHIHECNRTYDSTHIKGNLFS